MVGLGQWLSGSVALLAFVWGLIVYIRDGSSKRQAEQAERAARMITLLESIDLGGADVGLDAAKVRALHDEQIHNLQRIVRLGVADFSARALRPGVSLFALLGIAFYTVFFLVSGIALTLSVAGAKPEKQFAGDVVGLTFVTIGLLGLAVVIVVWRRRRVSRARRLAAGMTVPSPTQAMKATIADIETTIAVRRIRRVEQRRASAADEA